MSDLNPYRLQWDSYARKWQLPPEPDASGDAPRWPGDEWGNEPLWTKLFKTLFVPAGVENWKHCAEIGPGSGKYTNYVLQNSAADIIAFDISTEYLAVLKERLAAEIAARRVEPVVIPATRASELYEHIVTKGLVRQLDGFYSIDAMVHVDLVYLMTYVVTAALTLREGGCLILTLANAVSEHGFGNLMKGLSFFYPKQGMPSSKFEYVSPDMIRTIFERIGFAVQFPPLFSSIETERDLCVIATLTDLGRAESFRGCIM